MKNPWLLIPASDYEMHMSDNSVKQLQTLNKIMNEQIESYAHNKIAIFGVATGNGLEHVKKAELVYAVDINNNYLEICKQKYRNLNNVQYFCMNIEKDDYFFNMVNLVICNLIFEYVNEELVIKKISKILSSEGVLSIVIQKNNRNSFVSKTKYKSLNGLNKIHHDIDENEIIKILNFNGFTVINRVEYKLPNGKRLIRLDNIKEPFFA